MKIKNIIEILQKCDPEQEAYSAHGEITNIFSIRYKKMPNPIIFLASQEEAESYTDDNSVEEIK